MSFENPNPTIATSSPRPPLTTQTYHSPTGTHPGVVFRAVNTITTSTYQSPPWSWQIGRGASQDQLVPLAALAVILASLVAIVGILAIIAIILARAL